MLRKLKLSFLHIARAIGLFAAAARSRTRSRQLLILCYHGISLDDEHEWKPGLFMTAALFEERLKQLRRGGFSVLPLDEAVTRLRAGNLPQRAVAITFDDGNVDFHRLAWPLLKQYGFPATVYLTTYCCEKKLPVFPLMLSFLLWKARGRQAEVELPSGEFILVDATSEESRRIAELQLLTLAHDDDLSGIDEDNLARCVARGLDIDYDDLVARRMLHLMTPEEVRELAADGVDFQMHTHRHRSPLDEESYRGELRTNAEFIKAMTGATPRHFCYPSGTVKPEFEQWLASESVLSATTCERGIATQTSNSLNLPRLLDHSTLTEVEFEAWLCGMGALLPSRPVGTTDVDRAGRLLIERVPIRLHDAAVAGMAAISEALQTLKYGGAPLD